MTTRRKFLEGSLLGFTGAVAGCAQTTTNKRTGETGLLPETTPTESADTGPELPNQTASSLNNFDLLNEIVSLEVVSGTYPDDMIGHSFVVFAEPHHTDASLFAGHGVVMRMDYEPDRVDIHMSMVETPCYFADIATLGTEHQFECKDLSRFSMTLGSRVLSNTGFVTMDDRLLVTYDAGRPHEIDAKTLQVHTPVGKTEDWKGVMPDWMGMFMTFPFPITMTTAHPCWDHEEKQLYVVNFAPSDLSDSPFLTLLRWDGEGELEKWELLLSDGQGATVTQSIHQICVTRNHIILCDTAFASEFMDTFGGSSETMHRTESLFYIIPKAGLSNGGGTAVAYPITIPREAIHFLADFDDSDGFLTLHVAHNVSADGSEFLRSGDKILDGDAVREDLIGIIPAPMDLGALGKYTLDTDSFTILESKVIIEEPWMWGGPGFYTWNGQNTPERFTSLFWHSTGLSRDTLLQRMVDLYAEHPYRTVEIDDLPEEGCPSTIFRQDVDSMEIVDGFVFPIGRHGSSPEFVPRKDSLDDTDGYIVCTVVSDDSETKDSTGDEIWIFRADDLAMGPITRLAHPNLNIPFTLHTCWMERATERQSSYMVDMEADLGEIVQGLPAEIQEVFASEVYPRFSRD